METHVIPTMGVEGITPHAWFVGVMGIRLLSVIIDLMNNIWDLYLRAITRKIPTNDIKEQLLSLPHLKCWMMPHGMPIVVPQIMLHPM